MSKLKKSAVLPSPAVMLTPAPAPLSPRVIRMKRFVDKSGLSKSTLCDRLNPASKNHDPTMPKRIWLTGTPGKGAVGFLESDVDNWILALAAKSGVIHGIVQAQREMEVAA